MKTCLAKNICSIAKIPHNEYGHLHRDNIQGIYLGANKFASGIFVFTTNKHISPHIAILGMSGSGKTFLTRSIAFKLHIFENLQIILIDFNGEHGTISDYFGIKILTTFDKYTPLSDSVCINLHGFKDKERVETAKLALNRIYEDMLMRSSVIEHKLMVVVDEAWKLGKNCPEIDNLIREGRKYGVSVLLASQSLNDISEEMLSNFSLIFVMHTNDDLEIQKFSRNFGLGQHQINQIRNLSIGSAIAIEQVSSGRINVSMISRIAGIDLPKTISINRGNRMKIDIPYVLLDRIFKKNNIGDNAKQQIKSFCINDYISIEEFVAALLNSKIEDKKILRTMRELGFNDIEIADAFACNLSIKELQ